MELQGICKIKPEYILPEQSRKIDLDHVSDKDKAAIAIAEPEQAQTCQEIEEKYEPVNKKPRLTEAKKLKGQNKNRARTFIVNKEQELCDSLVLVQLNEKELPTCSRKGCVNLHDIDEYLKVKPEDIGSVCYNFETSGKCPRGLACRYGKSHINSDNRNIVDQQKYDEYILKGPYVKNSLDANLRVALRKKNYSFDLAEKLIFFNDKKIDQMTPEELSTFLNKPKKTFGAVTDEDIIKLKNKEKKSINWKDKLYLSPLTTVGNLPFRRICKEYGADITCGEMALCSTLLQGTPQEWALMKRHHTEDIFGVQLCANNPYLLTKCGQLLEKELDLDFIDVNLGCPIDWIYRKGGGSGLLGRPKVLESCIKNLSDILTIPLTVKSRTGAYSDQSIAHDLAPKFRDWGVSLLTIHGRSREQRYTKSADWAYIRKVALNAAPMPVFGNGDVLSFEDYTHCKELAPEVQGIMIGRGALIKPWLFTELKEQKLWDISSKERFDIIKKYVNYGLEHWGSDSRGVENTRKFLLEWLSFLYRYVPVGLLEAPPQKINQRPPLFRGRDDLETLMASPSASDWIKISEMCLGKVPEGFKFVPKHKANAYSAE